jgi:hypothetical protein
MQERGKDGYWYMFSTRSQSESIFASKVHNCGGGEINIIEKNDGITQG